MKKYDKKKLVPIYTLHAYYGSFANLYGCINYKDAYKIITKYHPELSLEEFKDDLIKQANDIKPWRYYVILEAKDDFWIYGSIGFDSKKHFNENDLALSKVHICSQDDYERVYTNKYDKKQYTLQAQEVLDYIDKYNPNITIQRLRMWHSTAIDFYSVKNPNDILNELKKTNCVIPDENYFINLLANFYDTYKKFGSYGRDLKQIRQNDYSNQMECQPNLKQQNKIGFYRIYQIANCCTNLYLVFDHYKLAKVVSTYYPQYPFDKVLNEVVDALDNFKTVSKNWRLYNFKVYKASKKDTYYTNDQYSHNYIVIDNHCPNAKIALFYATKVFNNDNFYIPKDINECLDYVNKRMIHWDYLNKISDNPLFHFGSYWNNLTEDLLLYSQLLNFNPQKFTDFWSNELVLDNQKHDLLLKEVNKFNQMIRLPALYGHTRDEAIQLNIVANLHINNLYLLITEEIRKFGWWK